MEWNQNFDNQMEILEYNNFNSRRDFLCCKGFFEKQTHAQVIGKIYSSKLFPNSSNVIFLMKIKHYIF
jgi:hypothetical protein